MTTGDRLCVASYNIHRGIGRDGRHDLQRIGAVLAELDADLIALQEVERLEDLAAATGASAQLLGDYRLLAGPTMLRGDASYGNALASRRPLRLVERLDLGVMGREPRGAILAELDTAAGAVLVVATHLGLRAWERSRQVRHLLDWLLDYDGPVILAGDFNFWWPVSLSLDRLRRRLTPVRLGASFPAGWPLLRLDRIFLGGGVRPLDGGVHRSPLAARASDHFPVYARLQLG